MKSRYFQVSLGHIVEPLRDERLRERELNKPIDLEK